MKQVIVYSTCVLILLLSGWAYFQYGTGETTTSESGNRQDSSEEPENFSTNTVDHTASFLVFTNGTRRDFSDPMYRNQSTEVFIDDHPNIVHVKNLNATWGDFFNTLPMTLTNDCLISGTGQIFCTGEEGELRFYLNEDLEPNLLEMPIREDDKALVSFGSDEEEIQTQLEAFSTLEPQEN